MRLNVFVSFYGLCILLSHQNIDLLNSILVVLLRNLWMLSHWPDEIMHTAIIKFACLFLAQELFYVGPVHLIFKGCRVNFVTLILF